MAFDKKRWRVFGNWLKTHRENAKFSQGGLADKIGVDRQTIYRLENALSGTKRETVIALAKALKQDVDEALILAGYSSQNGESFEVLEGVSVRFDEKKLTKEQRDEIIDVIRTVIAGVEARKRKDGS